MKTNFSVGTMNLFVGAVKNHPDLVIRDILLGLDKCHVIGLNEAGQAERIIKAVQRRSNARVYYGEGDAARSTPILWRPGMRVVDRHSILLTRRTNTNEPKAAGPTTVKEKRLNIVEFAINGRHVNYGEIHTTPSVWAKNHDNLNEAQVERSAIYMKQLPGIKILGGDFNEASGGPNTRPLRDRNFISTQQKFGPVGTNGNRDIDDIHVFGGNKRIVVNAHHTYNGISDHDFYWVDCFIKPRRKTS